MEENMVAYRIVVLCCDSGSDTKINDKNIVNKWPWPSCYDMASSSINLNDVRLGYFGRWPSTIFIRFPLRPPGLLLRTVLIVASNINDTVTTGTYPCWSTCYWLCCGLLLDSLICLCHRCGAF